ncbi:MAG: Bug family tripartite tricarboxylate transporter substrate binding protein [Lautropia sp.]
MFRRAFAGAMALSALGLYSRAATAQQDWPTRPLRFIIGFPPGGLNDVLARLFNEHVGKALNQPVVIDYKPGAAGRIAMGEMARAKADGYTLALGNTGALTVLPNLYSDLPYDPQKSFIPVTALGQAPLVMVVRNDASARSWKQLLEESKTKQMAHGSLGIGSPHHLAFEFLKSRDNFRMPHVPYKGTAEQSLAVLSGEINVGVDILPSMLPLLKEGKLRALAVTTAGRVPQLPDVPTFTELGYEGAVMTSWYLVLIPAGTPMPIVDRLAAEFRKAAESANVREYMNTQGLMPFPATRQEISAAIKQETERWGRLIRERNISVTN